MKYELARRLKEAGYPQKEDGYWTHEIYVEGTAYPPTIHELIDACMDGEHELVLRWRPESRWSAIQEGKVLGGGWFEMGTDIFDCETPEEALAELWLALK